MEIFNSPVQFNKLLTWHAKINNNQQSLKTYFFDSVKV